MALCCAPQIFRTAENCREFVNLALATTPGRVAARFGMRTLIVVDRRTIVRLQRDGQVRRARPCSRSPLAAENLFL